MKIDRTELTPNPDALKFIMQGKLGVSGSRHFDNADAAADDPLAKSLFAMGSIHSVFYTPDFVTVTKVPSVNWDDILIQVKAVVEAQAELVKGEGNVETVAAEGEGEMLGRIQSIIDSRIRPALAGDGGGLEVIGLDGYTLTIRYQGACGSCPSATAGTLRGIEHLLQTDVDPRILVVSG